MGRRAGGVMPRMREAQDRRDVEQPVRPVEVRIVDDEQEREARRHVDPLEPGEASLIRGPAPAAAHDASARPGHPLC